MTFVASVSAGPPFGGLYLKPPSRGGLCDGVTTMPSARWSLRPRLWTMIARDREGVGRAAVRRVVLEAAVTGRVVRRGHDDAVGEMVAQAAVVDDDRAGQGGRRRVLVLSFGSYVDAVRCQNLDGRAPCRVGQRVRVLRDVQGTCGALRGPVLDDSLGRRRNVSVVAGD